MRLTYEVRQKRNRGRQLKFAREYRGITQSKLAKSVKGLSQSNLSKYEKGLGGISEGTLQKTMEVLNFPMSFLDKIVGGYFVCKHW
ncbi:helix-turn-helix transcriptional regulator [Capnocytophaga canimorsus]|nr:helix-turn-helix transcriptional regulator [Capnocytophaga canimorsus]WGU68239.1 helix-turn-helix transcriptional regulator [Capnocytophaga canimorsus]WGU70657.1 helix-turn-helix transcriptional regulator [Capnocytophaga canimorsus]